MVDPNNLKAQDLLDYLAWKAAKLLGWDVVNARWRIGFRRCGEYASLIVYSMTPTKRNFESLQAGGLEILVPATSDEKKWLGCILLAAQQSPIRAGGLLGKEDLLPLKPCLEKILLEMDVEGWIPWRDRGSQQ